MFKDKTILITGGTGSFGRQFAGELLERCEFKKIIIFSRDEFKQDNMKKEFLRRYGPEKVGKMRFFIGDIRDRERLRRAFRTVDIVIHAAAMKQVPACEYNPTEAVRTNVVGAMNIIDAALDSHVEKVIALSTDKAVNPINLYGGTKLVSDKLFLAANAYSGESGTIFGLVRYGNVSGSRGSVIPFFRDLIRHGAEELPITDVRMTRFWMTLDKAVSLVMMAVEKLTGGETFVYKNPSYHVVDLCEAMSPGIRLKNIGIREGEKIHEVMITKDDSRSAYDYGDYFVIYPHFEWFDFEKSFQPGGVKVEDGFEYSSGSNSEWLSVEEIRRLMKEYDLFNGREIDENRVYHSGAHEQHQTAGEGSAASGLSPRPLHTGGDRRPAAQG
ncbi:MAG: UDP-N-acetylglucosamine 4,6-dehydratase (inverting) [Anaerovoracaceae bacterium]|jgi:UDP-N-acetylglucosamine 4,6-dehydratase